MFDVIQWLNPLETMAESLEQPNPVAVPECSFSSQCGRNIIVDGPTARWNSVVSGGRVVVDKPIFPGKELKLSFDGKGHAEVGILTKDPASIPDINHVEKLKELTVIQSAKIYKQTGTANIKRSDCGRKIITKADKESSVTIKRNDKVWVTVNIIFGDLEVEIETEGYNFSNKTGGNIQLENNDTWANLKFPNPCAVCFVGNPIRRKEALNFQIDPILRDGKPSRNFSIKIAISQSNPVNLLSENDTYDDITSLPVIHFDEIPIKCKNVIQIGLSDNGTVQINYDKGTLNKKTNNKQIFCIFEICRINLHCKGKIVDFSPSVETVLCESKRKKSNPVGASSIDQVDTIVVPPNPEYVRSKKMLESIRHDAESISIHSNDFKPANESRNIIGDVSLSMVNNGSNITNTAESRIRSNETLLPVDNISPSELNLRLQSVEETIGNPTTGKEGMRQSQYQELKLEIQAIKTMLGELQLSIQPQTNTKTLTLTELNEYNPEMSLNEVLQKNYVNLIKMIDTVPLLDLLYESDYIRHNECERLGKLSQTDQESANRDLLNTIIRRQSISLGHFASLLFQSKQIGVLAVLFPGKNINK
ncbi:uncharacterized protein LOC134717792 [Mytilus trossulus]|uniref:uncharacterized protein LOC134717792 n=1 Tax=Mytilus trossulus TaxID=6551 RepID=UPI0030048E16